MTGMGEPAAAWRGAVRGLAGDLKAAVSIEYAVIASLVSVAILGDATAVRDENADLYNVVAESFRKVGDASDSGNGELTTSRQAAMRL